ncbi:DUF1793-domain-containing protein [Auriscalpium vulgare]|uniref:DUF1793-domain-containing protein n=1 Tax=Auriscalpium vulgare TaxID=40419 RepID=A0ACB8RYX8_9AGAM|nr:DUF1793-domain-containing protein [Auriscalpium vulgare]
MAGLLLLLLLRPVFFWVLFLCFPESVVVQAQATLTPAAIPLAVRSPYFSCWEPSLNGSKWSGVWSTTFAGNAILGWAGLAKVDGVAYTFLGDQIGNPSFPGAKQTNLTQTTITPTRSIFNIQAGPVELILTFLSPIEPGDWVRQSMPFSYMSVDVQSLDGNSHRVQVYSDISGEWNSGDRGQPITWTTSATSDTVFHAVTLQNQAPFVEIQNQAEWGTLYIAAKAGSAVTYKTASDEVSRPEFITQGVLDNQLDTNFRTIPGSPGNTFPVFAISLDFGNIQSSQNPAVWAFGYSRDPALQYTDLSGQTTTRSLFYKTKYPKDSDTITDFLNDFPNAQTRAAQLDSKIMGDGASISSNYSDLLALSARQAYGATELTVGQNADGSPNPSDVMMFMKNIGGTIPGRINAVETLYAAFPMFMYMDPSLGAPLLEPLLRFQNSPNYTVGFAAADVGSKYPNATASNQQHQQSVEQSGNMLIMSYAYARASGDGSLLSKYYPLFKTWADFLVNNTLFISGQQLSGDNESGNNQTNLALKGIIAVQAMSGISAALNRSADMQAYASKASNLIQQWNSFALSDDKHLLAKYGDPSSSWTLGYNLFADSWLGTNLLDSSVLAGHTQFLATLQSQGITPTQFGVPIDSTNMAASFSTWNLFSAAIATDTTVRDGLISGVHNRATMNASAGAFPVTYDSSRGSTILGTAR